MKILMTVLASTPLAATDQETEHYDLHVEWLDAPQVGRILEQFYAQATAFFGKAPKKRLRVEVYATRERWVAALRADGQTVPTDSGGLYSPETRKAYLYLQPSEYSTRHLLLHEAAHQFHYLASTGNRSPADPWYTEGLAEYFAMHSWDGKTLKTGVVPAITLEDRPEAALRNFEAAGKNLAGLVTGTLAADRPEAWALVRWLVLSQPERFRELRRALDLGQKSKQAWSRVFGAVTPHQVQQFRESLVKEQQPWKVVWIHWEPRGDQLEGRSETNALAVLKSPASRLEVEITCTSETVAGVVFGFQSKDEFLLFQLIGKNRVRVMKRSRGKWEQVLYRDKPAGGSADVLLVIRDSGGSNRLLANGVEIATFEQVGDLGLNVDAGRALFRVR